MLHVIELQNGKNMILIVNYGMFFHFRREKDLKIDRLIYHVVKRNQQLKECKVICFRLHANEMIYRLFKLKHLDFVDECDRMP